MVALERLELSHPCGQRILHHTAVFTAKRGLFFVRWTMPSAYGVVKTYTPPPLSCPPSSLYTFPALAGWGFARRWPQPDWRRSPNLTSSTSGVSPGATPFEVRRVYQFRHSALPLFTIIFTLRGLGMSARRGLGIYGRAGGSALGAR